MIEIERKFLVTSTNFKTEAHKKTRIVQGFLNTHSERTVRIRIHGDKGLLTIKGKSSEDGLSRFEWEKEISLEDAQSLLNLCENGVIEKIRYEVKYKKHIFEIDEFLKDNKGLVIAEIELNAIDEQFSKPKWLGKEVTGQTKYYNSQLGNNPFNTWKK